MIINKIKMNIINLIRNKLNLKNTKINSLKNLKINFIKKLIEKSNVLKMKIQNNLFKINNIKR